MVVRLARHCKLHGLSNEIIEIAWKVPDCQHTSSSALWLVGSMLLVAQALATKGSGVRRGSGNDGFIQAAGVL